MSVVSTVERIIERQALLADRVGCEALLRDVAAVRGWLDSVELAVARLLNDMPGVWPEKTLSQAGRSTIRRAEQTMRRLDAAGSLPGLEPALAAGAVSVEHLDVVANTMRRLEPDAQALLAAEGDRLVAIAVQSTPAEFSHSVKQIALQVQRTTGDDGVARFQRQRSSITFRHWTDQITGMVCVAGEFDPERGGRFIGRLRRRIDTLFHERVPDGCPTDERKQRHLNALALLSLVGVEQSAVPARRSGASEDVARPVAQDLFGSGSGSHNGSVEATPAADASAAESSQAVEVLAVELPAVSPVQCLPGGCGGHSGVDLSVLIDYDTLVVGLHDQSVVDVNGAGMTLPVATLRRLACQANIIPIVLGGDGVVLDVGRARRLATQAQRRALRAMHHTCVVPDCLVSFDDCTIHHVLPFGEGGPSDIDNLAPVCSRHHHCLHEGGWTLRVHAGRVITIVQSNGEIMKTGPPRAA